MLGMFNTKAAVAGAVHTGRLLEDVEDGMDGPVANGMDGALQPGFVCLHDPVAQAVFRRYKKAGIGRGIAEWLEECGGMRTEGSVHKSLQHANAHPFVAGAFLLQAGLQLRPFGQGHCYIGPGDQCLLLAGTVEHRNIGFASIVTHMVNRGNTL